MTGGGDRRSQNFSSLQNEDLKKSGRTAKKVATDLGVSQSTVERAGLFSKGVDAAEKIESGTRDAILSGKSKIKNRPRCSNTKDGYRGQQTESLLPSNHNTM